MEIVGGQSVLKELPAGLALLSAGSQHRPDASVPLPIENGSVININIPQLSKGEPKGVRVVPQSSKGFDEYYIAQKNEQGQIVFQLTGDHHVVDGTPTDTTSLEEGYITITALAPDMTDHKKTRELRQMKW